MLLKILFVYWRERERERQKGKKGESESKGSRRSKGRTKYDILYITYIKLYEDKNFFSGTRKS